MSATAGVSEATSLTETSTAVVLRIYGRVQGVGFRPFVACAAHRCRLAGWVRNGPEGVTIHVEGRAEDVARFRIIVGGEAPSAAEVRRITEEPAHRAYDPDFRILPSLASATPTGILADIPQDRSTCVRCLAEFDDPANRRVGYSQIACTDCGPRFTMLRALPFDRERTAMAEFQPCRDCGQDYASATDRRFHAQNVACPECGPRLRFVSGKLEVAAAADDREVLTQAADLLRAGGIVAVKGIGGFHLLCDATDSDVVCRLRDRKRRGGKPLAVLFADSARLTSHLIPDELDLAAVANPAAPIVLMRRRCESELAEEVAPGLNSIGAMLSYSPTHRELVRLVDRPLVATSANASDEPMPIDDAEAMDKLTGIADALVMHDRVIERTADDSVVRTIGGRTVPLRVGRGLAPVRLPLPVEVPPILATGGHLKAAVAVTRGREIVLGPHIADLNTASSRRRYRDAAADLARLCGVAPHLIACDRHPDYFSTGFAHESGLPVVEVQHHAAHLSACLAEHGEAGPALGIVWDGTGFGDDGTVWGGEFLLFDRGRHQRVGSLWPFPLVGGDRAAREPRRSAAGVCFAAGEPIPHSAFSEPEARTLAAAVSSPRGAVQCTSAGRLFDAWASLLGLGNRATYEGEAALRLEEIADENDHSAFRVSIVEESGPFYRVDWRPWVSETRRLLRTGTSGPALSARFHNGLARCCVEVARRVGCPTVTLSGGCFQNRMLSERAEEGLREAGFRVLTHRRVPPGDGGLAAGQAWAAALWYLEGGVADVSGHSR